MNLKILFLDDEPMLCELFSDFFMTSDVDVKTFTDPAKAIEYSNTSGLDIIFIDYRLPRATGDTIATQMPLQIPKYLLTGELEPKPKYKFVGIIKKPFDGKAIRLILEAAWKSKQNLRKKAA